MALTVDDIKKWLGSLEQKRDELKLQAHLLGMEARDEFDKVDQSIDKFRGAVQWVSSTASAAAREAPATIKSGAEKLTRTVSKFITEFQTAPRRHPRYTQATGRRPSCGDRKNHPVAPGCGRIVERQGGRGVG